MTTFSITFYMSLLNKNTGASALSIGTNIKIKYMLLNKFLQMNLEYFKHVQTLKVVVDKLLKL